MLLFFSCWNLSPRTPRAIPLAITLCIRFLNYIKLTISYIWSRKSESRFLFFFYSEFMKRQMESIWIHLILLDSYIVGCCYMFRFQWINPLRFSFDLFVFSLRKSCQFSMIRKFELIAIADCWYPKDLKVLTFGKFSCSARIFACQQNEIEDSEYFFFLYPHQFRDEKRDSRSNNNRNYSILSFFSHIQTDFPSTFIPY